MVISLNCELSLYCKPFIDSPNRFIIASGPPASFCICVIALAKPNN